MSRTNDKNTQNPVRTFLIAAPRVRALHPSLCVLGGGTERTGPDRALLSSPAPAARQPGPSPTAARRRSRGTAPGPGGAGARAAPRGPTWASRNSTTTFSLLQRAAILSRPSNAPTPASAGRERGRGLRDAHAHCAQPPRAGAAGVCSHLAPLSSHSPRPGAPGTRRGVPRVGRGAQQGPLRGVCEAGGARSSTA